MFKIFKNKITEEEIQELNTMISDYHEDEFTISDLFLFNSLSHNVLKYKRYLKYVSKNYEEIQCGCSERRFKK